VKTPFLQEDLYVMCGELDQKRDDGRTSASSISKTASHAVVLALDMSVPHDDTVIGTHHLTFKIDFKLLSRCDGVVERSEEPTI